MSQQRTDGLEILRQRATCPICKEFYTTPKRLGCSHVFCLNCIKRHLQVHRAVNFPPCPMCRRPISKAYSDVTSLEPARAEEDIVEFVKQFEICGLCQQRENPSVKCIDCKFLLCGRCRMAHDMMQPTHVTLSITSCNEIIQLSKLQCKQHGKPMNKFCVMCERAMCVLCEWFEHDVCKRTWDEHDVQNKYRQAFLSHFIRSININVLSKTQVTLPRVVDLNEIVLMGRKWQTDDSKNQENKGSILRNRANFHLIKKPLTTLPGSHNKFGCANDVLILQKIFMAEHELDMEEGIQCLSKLTFGYILALMGRILFDIAFRNVMDVLPSSLWISLFTIYILFSSAGLWVIFEQWVLLVLHLIVVITYRQLLLFPNLYDRTLKIVTDLSLQIVPSLPNIFILYQLSFTNNQSVVGMLTAAGVAILLVCQRKLRVRLLEYRPVQSVRSYLCFPIAVIFLLAILLSLIAFDIPDWLWWELSCVIFLLAVDLLTKFLPELMSWIICDFLTKETV